MDSAQILSTTNLLPFEGLLPTFEGATINDVNVFQSALLDFDDTANPIDIFAFELQVLAPVGLNSFTGFGMDGVATVIPDDGIFSLGEEYIDITVRSGGVLPPPGAGLVLLGGGLSMANRGRPPRLNEYPCRGRQIGLAQSRVRCSLE